MRLITGFPYIKRPKVKPRQWGPISTVQSAVRNWCENKLGSPAPLLACAFWENSGVTLYNYADLTNNATSSGSQYFRWVNQGIDFDGDNANQAFILPSSLNFSNGEPFTILMDCETDGDSDEYTVIGDGGNNNFLGPMNGVGIRGRFNNTTITLFSSSSVGITDRHQHVLTSPGDGGTYDVEYYQDGAHDKTTSINAPGIIIDRIGNAYGSDTYPLDGRIFEVIVWPVQLNAAQVALVYEQPYAMFEPRSIPIYFDVGLAYATNLFDSKLIVKSSATDNLDGKVIVANVDTDLLDGKTIIKDSTTNLLDGKAIVKSSATNLLDGKAIIKSFATDLLDGKTIIKDSATNLLDGKAIIKDSAINLLDGKVIITSIATDTNLLDGKVIIKSTTTDIGPDGKIIIKDTETIVGPDGKIIIFDVDTNLLDGLIIIKDATTVIGPDGKIIIKDTATDLLDGKVIISFVLTSTDNVDGKILIGQYATNLLDGKAIISIGTFPTGYVTVQFDTKKSETIFTSKKSEIIFQ